MLGLPLFFNNYLDIWAARIDQVKPAISNTPHTVSKDGRPLGEKALYNPERSTFIFRLTLLAPKHERQSPKHILILLNLLFERIPPRKP